MSEIRSEPRDVTTSFWPGLLGLSAHAVPQVVEEEAVVRAYLWKEFGLCCFISWVQTLALAVGPLVGHTTLEPPCR